ncbi:MFS multidrug transporter [Aspergillus affinis]|uniref:MFS multidrug transporter n=1 Tax=Aspergillus affinis TaxID=1070780 RepID=UPI0022FDC796|nr:MFS multidrug transporter [Aspergillus affinis]KAI9034951.1 MFS multidrug transporter [Aspergillus affinis]
MTIVATAISRITDEFKSLDQYASVFFLTFALFQSTWGKGYKYFPPKSTFLGAVSIFKIGSLVYAVAKNSTTLIVGRAVAGMVGGGIASGAYTIIAFSAPPRQRPAFTGLMRATYGLASVIGPLLGGVFTDKASWRWCFYINLPIGGSSAVIMLFLFRAPPAAQPAKARRREKILQMDLMGTFTIMAAIVCYLLALQWGGVTKAWSSADVIGTIVGFMLITVLFVVIECIWANSLYVFFLSGAMFILIYYLLIRF